jgi:3-oxoacyl-(acyl-carrier-protein) synthase
MNLSLVSAGAVTPAGIGADTITAAWPISATQDASGRPATAALVPAEHPSLVRWQKEPRLRRASPITYYMIEAVAQAVEHLSPEEKERTGIIATFFLGCLVYSVRFYRQITDEGRRFASPVLFPETVFNSPLSHVVATLGLHGPVYSQIGDRTCWASALRTAQTWLSLGTCDQVVVLGAEEFSPIELNALRAGGLLRCGLIPAEGCVALMFQASSTHDSGLGPVVEGFSFAQQKDAARARQTCLDTFPADIPVLEATGDDLTKRPDGFTVSAAADTYRAYQMIRAGETNDLLLPVTGLTRQVAAYRVRR